MAKKKGREKKEEGDKDKKESGKGKEIKKVKEIDEGPKEIKSESEEETENRREDRGGREQNRVQVQPLTSGFDNLTVESMDNSDEISPVLPPNNQPETLEQEVAGVPVPSQEGEEGEELYSTEYSEENYGQPEYEGEYRSEREMAREARAGSLRVEGPTLAREEGREVATRSSEPGPERRERDERREYETETPEREGAMKRLWERRRE